MYFDGCTARWAVAHFSQKPAGCPLNCIALCLLRHAALRGANEGKLRGASVRSMIGVVWVDGFVFHKRHGVEWHEPCGGLAAARRRAALCAAAAWRRLAAAEVLDEWWMDLNRQLGVSLKVEKHQRCKQTVEYAGFLFDTLREVMLVLKDKQAVLLEQATSLRPESAARVRSARCVSWTASKGGCCITRRRSGICACWSRSCSG